MALYCPVCNDESILVRMVAGPEPEVNAGAEFELEAECGCDTITRDQWAYLHEQAAADPASYEMPDPDDWEDHNAD